MARTSTRFRIATYVAALLFVSLGPGAAFGQSPDRPHILISNDDGIEAPGIAVLARELAKIGDVIVFAPSANRSGSSMALDLRSRIQIERVMHDGELFGYGVNTTPAGAVLLGLEHETEVGRPVDLVVSGINQGANVGDLAHFSGTVGSAMAAAYYGIPAVAVSADARAPNYGLAARFVAQFIEELLRRDPAPGVVYSINVPAGVPAEGAEAVVAPMGGSYFRIGFDVRLDDTSGVAVPRFDEEVVPEGSDTELYTGGRVTITPLRFDWTDWDVLRDLRTWNLVVR